MPCETCQVREFVHSDLYCRGCLDKPKPKMKYGDAYLFMRNSFKPITSVSIEAPEGSVADVVAAELLKKFRIEFVEHDGKELTKLILKETRK